MILKSALPALFLIWSVANGQLLTPGRRIRLNDPITTTYDIPVTRTQTVLRVAPVQPKRQQVTLSVVPRPRPIAPPLYLPEPLPQPPVEPENKVPYSFSYSTDLGNGASSSREESSDGNTVTGSYSYFDSDGLYRQVDYIADESGYRATIRTNEPGTERVSQGADPDGTTWEIEPPPPAVVARYASNALDQPSGRRQSTPSRQGRTQGRTLYGRKPVEVTLTTYNA